MTQQDTIAEMIAALEAAELDYAGESPTGNDPHSMAIRAVREVLNKLRGDSDPCGPHASAYAAAYPSP